MALVLFTDFGSNDLYVGQVEAALHRDAPGLGVIHLLHEAPMFNPKASAHLLAALVTRMPAGNVYVAVVDPGVGSARDAVLVQADGDWFVGPDNGLLSVVAYRAASRQFWRAVNAPADSSVSFHGRDIFAPIAAGLEIGRPAEDFAVPLEALSVSLAGGDLAEIIYVDHYGNAFTGIRATNASTSRQLVVGSREVGHASVFSSVTAGTAFWYANSVGLVEVAVSGGSASRALDLAVGQPVRWA
jgi:S-adenosyl-L-methionine hydrolase (adenosine-forming)